MCWFLQIHAWLRCNFYFVEGKRRGDNQLVILMSDPDAKSCRLIHLAVVIRQTLVAGLPLDPWTRAESNIARRREIQRRWASAYHVMRMKNQHPTGVALGFDGCIHQLPTFEEIVFTVIPHPQWQPFREKLPLARNIEITSPNHLIRRNGIQRQTKFLGSGPVPALESSIEHQRLPVTLATILNTIISNVQIG